MRPQFHFTAKHGWINDPHGITVRDGVYEAFFQYVPDSTVWGPNCHWGHATGPDLLSLEETVPAIIPGEGDDGIWTGSLTIDDDGEALVHYTAVSVPDFRMGRVRTARPTDESWQQWRKHDVVVNAPADLDLIAFRDPFVFPEADGWRMLVGAGSMDGTASALSYRSSDLGTWTFEGALLSRPTTTREPVWTGSLWECPQLIRFGDTDALIFSVWDDDNLHYVAYCTGEYANGKFSPGAWHQMSYGPSLYAPSLFTDADGQPCITFWMRGVADVEAGWAGAHSVPYRLEPQGDRLVASPHPDIEKYRRESVAVGDQTPGLVVDAVWNPGSRAELTVKSNDRVVLSAGVAADQLDVRANDSTWVLPYTHGPIRAIIDGPTLEISTADGVLASPISPDGERLVIAGGGQLRLWALSK